MPRFFWWRFAVVVATVGSYLEENGAFAEETKKAATPTAKASDPSPQRTQLEAAFSKMLSGATLEGSFTTTRADADGNKLSSEKYTLCEVKKLEGNYWLIPARIQYGEHDATIPLVLPVRWAGDTPVIVVDEVGLPGFGTVSARVMFFADHYAGYWKHGKSGGHLFGTISREEKPTAEGEKRAEESSGENEADE